MAIFVLIVAFYYTCTPACILACLLKEENLLEMSVGMLPGGIYGSRSAEETGLWSKFYYEEFHVCTRHQIILIIIEKKTTGRARQVRRMGKTWWILTQFRSESHFLVISTYPGSSNRISSFLIYYPASDQIHWQDLLRYWARITIS